MKKLISILTLCILFSSCSYDEENLILENKKETNRLSSKSSIAGVCGTTGIIQPLPLSEAQIAQLSSGTPPSVPACTPITERVVRIKYHIVKDVSGVPVIPESDLDIMTSDLNTAFSGYIQNPNYPYWMFFWAYFTPHYVQPVRFEKTEVNYITDSQYYDVVHGSPELTALFAEDNDPSMLNVYIVNSIPFAGGAGIIDGIANGYGTNASILSSIDGRHLLYNTLAHEVGHNFGLYHVFENSGSLCLDSNTSSSTGDLIADTPVDNTALNEVSFDANCNHTGHKETCVSSLDPRLTIPFPDWQAEFIALNLMSYVRTCRTSFTPLQKIQMANHPLIPTISYIESIPTCDDPIIDWE